MTHALSNAEKTRKLPWSLAADFTNVVHFAMTFSPTVLLLFFDTLGLNKQRMGVLLAVITLCDLVSLFVAPIAERLGYKRVFLWFWTARKLVFALFILAPWVLHRFSPDAAFQYVVVVMLVFALCRSIGVAALLPWMQEYIPQSIRGKYTALQTVVTSVAIMITASLLGRYLGSTPDEKQFQWIFGFSIGVGLLAIFFYSRIPGGKPVTAGSHLVGIDTIFAAARDKKLWTFLAGSGFVTVGWGLMSSFLPLFYKNIAGIPPERIFYLDAMYMTASLVSCFFWGWAADRFGSKPVMVLNLIMLGLYPIGLLFMPLGTAWSFYAAISLVSVIGFVAPGWTIGYSRYLYVNLVPQDNRAGYTAIHSAVIGVLTACAPFMAGSLLELTSGLSGSWFIFTINPWTPFFIVCLFSLIPSVIFMSLLPPSGAVEVTRFAGMFFQGNPLAAIQGIIAFERGGQEHARVVNMEKLGGARSPFSVDQLIRGLHDPSFNVRYEAVISIARTLPDPQLTAALIQVMEDDEPDLAIMAAWGLGRIGDKAGIPALRRAAMSSFPLLRARASRSLAVLGDHDSAPVLLDNLRNEKEAGIRLAYASALGTMNRAEALPALLEFLRELQRPRHRLEVALAIATILGEDDRAVRLWRRMEDDPGDALAGVILGLGRQLARLAPGLPPGSATLDHVIERCAHNFGVHDMEKGAAELRVLASAVDLAALKPSAALVLQECIAGIDQHTAQRLEYITLCVHTLHVGILPTSEG